MSAKNQQTKKIRRMIPLFKRKNLSTHARINVEANRISGKSRRELLQLQVREQDLKQKIGFLKEDVFFRPVGRRRRKQRPSSCATCEIFPTTSRRNARVRAVKE